MEYLLLIEDSVVYLEERTWLLQDMSLRSSHVLMLVCGY